ncbi:methylenetetrahydrofolate--tRNA-(uracil(54)-C(5))-methyltransferase (FADH(2)-oxidizing) TrmFO, partial [candidate division WOR-3 bacterium]|nr:methylenetetrahydrofolate--tRNA-(uracil(54)-C(5))-methyltransferase (FADH(2)-oxidizing) TrmFO [candidate division WOR-3 bacterium]
LGSDHLFFYDAIAPIVSADSLDLARVFAGSRYGVGSDYLNCPLSEEEYDRFVAALLEAELHPLHDFEGPEPETKNRKPKTFFEGCLPIEEMARRGRLVPAFGPMKPVGLVDPRGHDPKSPEDFGHVPSRPFAVVQLRRENAEGTMYNLVGFQTRLRHGEQARVFRLIPGLERATFLRFGSIHRNTYLDSPHVLLPTLQMRARPDLLVAGQLTGMEGYVESMGAGLVAGINAARLARGEAPVAPSPEMMLGSLLSYVTGGSENPGLRFQPMNANFGLLPSLARRLRGREKRQALGERALAAAGEFVLTLSEKRA